MKGEKKVLSRKRCDICGIWIMVKRKEKRMNKNRYCEECKRRVKERYSK